MVNQVFTLLWTQTIPYYSLLNPKNNSTARDCVVPDSCKLICRSRDQILGFATTGRTHKKSANDSIRVKTGFDKIQLNYSTQRQSNSNGFYYSMSKLRKKPEYFTVEEEKDINTGSFKTNTNTNPDSSNKPNYCQEPNGRLTAKEISEDVVYKNGGIGMTNSQRIPKTHKKIKPELYVIKDEIIERKQRLKAYQHIIIKSMESESESDLSFNDIEDYSINPIYTMNNYEIHKNIPFINSKIRIRTKPDIDTKLNTKKNYRTMTLARPIIKKYGKKSSKVESIAKKPYIGGRVKTKNAKMNSKDKCNIV